MSFKQCRNGWYEKDSELPYQKDDSYDAFLKEDVGGQAEKRVDTSDEEIMSDTEDGSSETDGLFSERETDTEEEYTDHEKDMDIGMDEVVEKMEEKWEEKNEKERRYNMRQRKTEKEGKEVEKKEKKEEDDKKGPMEEESEEEETWEVERIIGMRKLGKKRNGETVFRAVWKTGERTWEPAISFAGGAAEVLTNYLAGQEEKKQERKQRTERQRERYSERIKKKVAVKKAAQKNLTEHQRKMREEASEIRKNRNEMAIHVRKAAIKVKGAGKHTVPRSQKEARDSNFSGEFQEAEVVEITAFNTLKAWKLVPRSDLPKGRRAMAVRFAYDIKTDVDGEISRFKARLVARGDLSKDGIDHFEDELFARGCGR